jgi:hypothetical protein
MLQLSLFAATPTTIPLDPLGEPIYRFRRDGQWWDGRGWVDSERLAIQVVGDRLLTIELETVGEVDVINEKGEVINARTT